MFDQEEVFEGTGIILNHLRYLRQSGSQRKLDEKLQIHRREEHGR